VHRPLNSVLWGRLWGRFPKRHIYSETLVNGVSESAGINRLGIENEIVLQRTTSH